jgi:NAD(P)-dependent dehydrogenase (short-subunit alcohol dehydrogenase family)
LNIENSRCLVIGGGRGLGREVALDLAAAGADVAISFHHSAFPAATTVESIQGLGRRATAVAGDVRTAAGATDLVCDAAAALGGLDAVVYAASGPFIPHPPHEVDEESWDGSLDTVAKGFFFSACAAREIFVAGERGGVIVAITDVASSQPWAAFAAHCAAKAAQAMLVRTLALAWTTDDIRVAAVAPGPLELPDDPRPSATARASGRTVLGRAARPGEVVAAVRFCIENDYVTGTELLVDGGMSLR